MLDASVLIAFLEGTDDRHVRAEALLAREIDDEFAVNALTLAEVLVAPIRDNELPVITAALQELDIRELPFPAGTAAKLATLRAGTNLKMPDCCVLLVAEEVGARLASFDHRLADIAARRGIVTVRS